MYIRSAGVAASIATLTYLWVLPPILRGGFFTNFYDLQARALLDGRMDVPPGSLGIEAFIHDGRHYLYFPPGPALLRMPLLAVTERFDGRLTALSMLLAWALTVTFVVLLLWRVRRIVRGAAPLSRLEAVAYGFLVLACTSGSVVLFLASIPWVYHEAYSWAIAMALGFAFCLLGVVQRPTRWRVAGTGAFAVGAVLSRTTAGWACVGAILLAAVFLPARTSKHDRQLWWKLWLAAALPLAIGAAVNWAKFRHPFLFPIDQQVFTRLSARRREAIAVNGGDLFAPNLIWSTLVNYFRPNGIRFVSVYPYVTLPPEIAKSYSGGFIDQANRTGSITAFAPLLLCLSLWGVISTLRPRAPERLRGLRIPLLGLGAIPLGVLFYAYIAHRYTSEFMPILVVGGAIGFAELARRADVWSLPARRLAVAGTGGLAVFSLLASVAVATTSRALGDPGGDDIRGYVARQHQISRWTGDPLDRYVEVSDELPPVGAADRIQIVGDCDAYFLGSGDEFHPWIEVDTRDLRVRVALSDQPSTARASALIALFLGHRTSELLLDGNQSGRFRLRLSGDGLDQSTEWFDAPRSGFTIAVTRAGAYDYRIVAESVPDEPTLYMDRESFNAEWRSRPNVLRPVASGNVTDPPIAASLTPVRSASLEQCEQLLRDHRS